MLRLTLGAVAASLALAAPAQADTPQYVQDYLGSISGTQAVFTGPGGTSTLTCAGRALDVGAPGAWEAQSQDCRDLVSRPDTQIQLMARRGATSAVLRDLDRAGRPLDTVAMRWAIDGSRSTVRFYAIPGGPYRGFGEWTCDAAGDGCALTARQTAVPRTSQKRHARTPRA
jgi:hypothetical protein